jgi:hypothetical protein
VVYVGLILSLGLLTGYTFVEDPAGTLF